VSITVKGRMERVFKPSDCDHGALGFNQYDTSPKASVADYRGTLYESSRIRDTQAGPCDMEDTLMLELTWRLHPAKRLLKP
jgi:hypothetical protein